MNINKKIDRREFIKDVSLAGLGITVGASLMGTNISTSSAQNTSKLVIASHSDAVTGVKINPDIAKKIVDAGIIQYTGQKTIADAWRSIFPSLLPNDLITIKVNCINPSLSSHPQVVDAITSGLITVLLALYLIADGIVEIAAGMCPKPERGAHLAEPKRLSQSDERLVAFPRGGIRQ